MSIITHRLAGVAVPHIAVAVPRFATAARHLAIVVRRLAITVLRPANALHRLVARHPAIAPCHPMFRTSKPRTSKCYPTLTTARLGRRSLTLSMEGTVTRST